jgi:hypothetical protein
MYNEGNSVIVAHEAAERLADINEGDEGGVGKECPACSERTMEKVYLCKAADNKEVTAYCYVQGKRGCLWRLTQRCAEAKEVMRCSRCGETEEI